MSNPALLTSCMGRVDSGLCRVRALASRRGPRVHRQKRARHGTRLYRLAAVLFFTCTLLPPTTTGGEWGRPVTGVERTAFLKSWGEYLHRMHSLYMVFTQEKHLRLLRQPLVTQGELWLQGNILYYVLKNATGQTELQLRMDSNTIKTYYPLLQTVEVIELAPGQSLPVSIPFLGRDPEALVKAYDIEVFATAERHTVHLTPHNPASPVRDIHLRLQNFQPLRFSQNEKNGNRLDMHITAFTPNAAIAASQLELHVPQGTTVTHPLK